MEKLIGIMLVFLAIFLLASCDGNSSDDNVRDNPITDDDIAVDDDADTDDDTVLDDDTSVDDDTTIDDDTSLDDDTLDDDTTEIVYEGLELTPIVGGTPGWWGTSLVKMSDNSVRVVAAKAEQLVVYDLSAKAVSSEVVSQHAGYASAGRDSNDALHIVFYSTANQGVQYITNASGEWVKRTIEQNARSYWKSLVVAPDDSVHLFYITLDTNILMYATNQSGSWVKEEISEPGDQDFTDAALAVDSQSRPHLVYPATTSNQFIYLTKPDDEQGWQSAVVENTRIQNSSLVTDSDGHVFMAYEKDGDLIMTTNVSGSWSKTTIDHDDGDEGIVGLTGIALDENEKVHIAYQNPNAHSNSSLKYATNQSGSWVVSILDDDSYDTGWFPSMAVTASGHALISYYDMTQSALMYRDHTPGKADIVSTLDSGHLLADSVRLTLDADGKMHLLTDDRTSGQLVYITNQNGSWQTTELKEIDVEQRNETNLAVDDEGHVHVVFCVNGEVSYLYFDGSDWTEELIDDAVLWGCDLALDSTGAPHISYCHYESETKTINYAVKEDKAWVITPIASNTRQMNRISVDSLDYAHIAYQSEQNEMVHATDAGGDWATELIVQQTGIDDIAMQIDASDSLNLSLLGSDEILYQTDMSGAWSSETVEGDLDQLKDYTALAMDDQATPHLLYTDASGWFYSCRSDDGWPIMILDRGGEMGQWSSLAIKDDDELASGSTGAHALWLAEFPSGCSAE